MVVSLEEVVHQIKLYLAALRDSFKWIRIGPTEFAEVLKDPPTEQVPSSFRRQTSEWSQALATLATVQKRR